MRLVCSLVGIMTMVEKLYIPCQMKRGLDVSLEGGQGKESKEERDQVFPMQEGRPLSNECKEQFNRRKVRTY